MTSRMIVDWRSISRWVWVLIALAAVYFVLAMIASGTVELGSAYGFFVGVTPALIAAALMFVEPRQRLIRIAAFCFALPIAVNTVIGGGILLAARTMSSDYAYLAPRLAGLADAFGLIAWIFPIIAVIALAMFIGRPRDRADWVLVAVGVILAVLQAGSVMVALPDGVPLERVLTSVLAQTIWIAWAYLLAVAWAQRMTFISVAALSHLFSGVVSFVSFTLLRDQFAADPNGLASQAVLAALWVLGVISWAALIVGIVRELPSERRLARAASARSQEALSLGR